MVAGMGVEPIRLRLQRSTITTIVYPLQISRRRASVSVVLDVKFRRLNLADRTGFEPALS